RRRHTRSYGDWSSDVCSSDLDKTAEAIDAYRRALRVAPAAAEIWNDLGTAYFAAGEAAHAADCYRRALRYRPGGVVALTNLGSRSEERRVGKECRSWSVPV